MKKGFFILALISSAAILMGQSGLQLQYKLCTQCPTGDQQNIDYTYDDTSSNYETFHVESDYDMRITAGTKYHQGIDLLPRATCRGDAVLSVDSGTVAYVKGNGLLKNIVIQNGDRAFVYMHIFRDEDVSTDGIRSGDFILKSVGSEYTIINMNANPVVAYARTDSLQVTYKRYPNSTQSETVYTTNQVVAGAMIAPIGDSGDVPVHLHVALIENPLPFQNNRPDPAFQGGRHIDRSIDPWTELTHVSNSFTQRLRTRKPGNFSLQECEHPGPGTDQWGQILLSYTDNTRNTVEIEVQMQNAVPAGNDQSRYNNTVMDQEEVVLGIKNTLTDPDFKVAKGSDFDSKFIINPVGAKKIYPSRMYDPDRNTNGIYGDPTTNGISPFTYRDVPVFHPHDHYFVADFYTRLHKEDKQLPDKLHKLAAYPWEAFYPDGDYQFRSKVLDVDGTWYPMANPLGVELDNFKPFIRAVNITSGLGIPLDEQIYFREWVPTTSAGILRLSGTTCKDPATITNQVVTIYATASESLRRLRAYIWNVNGWVEGTPLPYDPSDPESWGNQKWMIRFPGLTLNPDQCYQVVFDGEDLNGDMLGEGHRLLSPLSVLIDCMAGAGSSFTVPHRMGGVNAWSSGPAEGEDWVHKFKVNDCGQRPEFSNIIECFTAREVNYDITYTNQPTSNGAIDMTIQGGTGGMAFTWTNEASETVGDTEDLIDVPAGRYCVEVKFDCLINSPGAMALQVTLL